MIRFVIVTGMSGAGRGSALRILEDMGYFCIDNLPVLLIPKLTKSIYGREKNDRQSLHWESISVIRKDFRHWMIF